jgi:hypothetical protein
VPYNPCGYIVDWTRRAHDEPCRFFVNNDRVGTVRFFEAEPDALVFPGWSVVYCSESDPAKYPDDSIGTLRRPPFGATLETAPKGLFTGRFCGTLQQHANGATFDASAPPIPIAANGWPLCCNPPPRVFGGPGLGGKSAWTLESGGPIPGPSCPAATPIANPDNGVFTLSAGQEGWFTAFNSSMLVGSRWIAFATGGTARVVWYYPSCGGTELVPGGNELPTNQNLGTLSGLGAGGPYVVVFRQESGVPIITWAVTPS